MAAAVPSPYFNMGKGQDGAGWGCRTPHVTPWVLSWPFQVSILTDKFPAPSAALDHGQGGAQGIEDGLAVGLVLAGVEDPSQIEERLAAYEKAWRNRAASIQILSNVGFDEAAPPELSGFLEGQPIPSEQHGSM